MKYYNIRNSSQQVSFREAVTMGMASDMGLFMPAETPLMESGFFVDLNNMELPEIAFRVASKYIGEEIPEDVLEDICKNAFDFPLVMRQIDEKRYSLELFHGPTGAFKDFGARFMSQCFSYFASTDDRRTVVLVATSGDTGGAIASSFLGIEGTDVVILYPSGKVSELQEKQLTALGKNITALEIEGTFDDCQLMVKKAFALFDTRDKIRLTSANSINIARLIPQSFYYYYAVSRLGGECPVVSVPSGNFGNLTAAILAWKTGLRIKRFIASTNINNVVPEYLNTGLFNPRKSVQTISNAMDVGNPSNFDRMLNLFGNDEKKVQSMVSGFWYTDDQIRNHIKEEYVKSGYILDPHGAVASMGLDEYLNSNPTSSGIFAETAHPAKFMDIVQPLVGEEVSLPENLSDCLKGEKKSVMMKPDYTYLEQYLKERFKINWI